MLVVVVPHASVAGKAKTCTDVYSDVMARPCGGSLACGKANWFLEGSQVHKLINSTSTSPELVPSLQRGQR